MTVAPLILTVDVGTSSLKAVVYDGAGQVVASAGRRYGYQTPQAGWAEADPEAWWEALAAALDELRAAPLDLHAVEVLALTGQMHTAVLLDTSGMVVPPTILWLDRRAAAETAELQARLGLPPYQLNSTYTLPKLAWLARHEPAQVARAAHILWPKDYLRYRLTGTYLTDRTEAGGAALLDWDTLTWANDRMAAIGLDPALLPPFRAPHEDAGALLSEWAGRFGLRADLRVITGAGDVLALITGAPPELGQVTCSLGSSSMVFMPQPPGYQAAEGENRLYVYPLLPYPLLGGVTSTSGAALQWAWQAFYEGELGFEDAVAGGMAVAPGAEGLFFLPFLSGERSPFWNDGLAGGFYGLTLAHRRPHMLRAVLEGVAFSLRYLLDIFTELGAPPQTIALAGGGAAVAGWPQLTADICRLPVRIYAGQETVTRGAYAYARQALGDDFSTALAATFDAPITLPPSPDARYEAQYRRYRLLAEFAAAHL